MDKDFDNSEEFKSLSPEKLRDLFDHDAKELFPESFSMREDDLGLGMSCAKKTDFSMGAYFKGRSSYPGVSENTPASRLSHLDDLPEQDTGSSHKRLQQDRRTSASSEKSSRKSFRLCELPASSFQYSEHNSINLGSEDVETSRSSIKSLAEFFADPDKSPLSSSAIMDHVLNYCKIRHEKNPNATRVNRESGVSRKRHSDSVFDTQGATFQGSIKRETENYSAFSSALLKKKHTSRCSTPDRLVKSGSPSLNISEDDVFAAPKMPIVHTSTFQTEKSTRSRSKPLQESNSGQPPPSGIQLQLNLPTPTTLSQNFAQPLVINIVCPPGESQSSSMAMINSQTGAGQDISRQSNPPANSGGTSRPQMSIQFSGTIQWNQLN